MKYIIANWKMYITEIVKVEELLKGFMGAGQNTAMTKNKVIVCPSNIHMQHALDFVNDLKQKHDDNTIIEIGAQNCSEHELGAFTGETSASALKDLNAKYCIIGHSERRQYHSESDNDIRAKLLMLIKNNISPIICCGEDLDTYEAGKTIDLIKDQLSTILQGFKNNKDNNLSGKKVIIAYEPIWAIGSGKTPTPEEVNNIHSFIKNFIKEQFAINVKVVYGGSVNKNNHKAFLDMNDIDGVLVGGASTKIDDFSAMIFYADKN